MIKKHAKTNPIRSVIMRTPPSLTGGAFFYGRIKSGKTCAMMSLAQKYKDNLNFNYKIIDLFGGHRKENLYWVLPSIDAEYWERVRKALNITEKQELPKQYKVNLLYPFFASQLPKQLPSNPPNVKSKIFTIPFKDVVSDDIKLVIDSMSQQSQYIWREALLQIKKNDGGAKLIDILIKYQSENINLYRNFVNPLVKEGFLQSEICDYNLNLLDEIRDREVVSVLCLDFVPPVYHLFIMGWFLRKTTELIDAGKIRNKNIFILREASEWFKATVDSVVPDRVKFFRALMSNWIRYGRRGIHMFLDTQSPAETRGLVEGSQDLTLLGRISGTSKRDRAEIADSLFSVGKMTKKQIQKLNDLRSGEFFIIEGYKDARKVYFLLPRSAYWQEGDGNFYSNVWKKYVDKWVDIRNDKEIIIKQFKEENIKLIEERKFKNELEKQKKLKKKKPQTIKEKEIPELKEELNGEDEKNEEDTQLNNTPNEDVFTDEDW